MADRHEAAGHPGYRGFVDWLRGRPCFADYVTAGLAYVEARGREAS